MTSAISVLFCCSLPHTIQKAVGAQEQLGVADNGAGVEDAGIGVEFVVSQEVEFWTRLEDEGAVGAADIIDLAVRQQWRGIDLSRVGFEPLLVHLGAIVSL